MKKQLFLFALIGVLIMSCANAKTEAIEVSTSGESEVRRADTNANNNAPSSSSVSDIEGNEWKLIYVYIDGKDTRFSRSALPAEPGNFFTLSFDSEHISGVGVPNRYSAPYTRNNNQLSIMLIRSTMMASFFQPENITEHDFFVYLQNAHSWKLADNNLELLSKTADGSEARLVFSL